MYRVIIVDDEPMIRKGLRETIEWDELGLEIVGEASNGIEALEVIESARPQILITDIKMPGMNGLELIHRIRERNLGIKVIILSGYSDYEYLKDAIKFGVESYLLKPIDNDELISILRSIVKDIEKELYSGIQQREGALVLRNNTLNRLVTNSICLKELKEKAEFLDICIVGSQFAVCVLADMGSSTNTASHQDQALKLFSVLNICQEIALKASDCLSFVDSNNLVVQIFTQQEINGQNIIREIVSREMEAVTKHLEVELAAGIGDSVHKMEDIHLSYETARHCLNYSSVVRKGKITSCEDLKTSKSSIAGSLRVNFELIGNYVRLEKIEELLKYIENCFHDFSTHENLSLDDIRNYVIQVAAHIGNSATGTENGVQLVSEELGLRYSDILELKRVDDFKIWMKEYLERVFLFKKNKVDRKTSWAVQEVTAYVAVNFSKDVSLKQTADKVFMNASYLGQIFKKEIGDTFTDYVNKYRVKKAMEILAETNLKVYEVAERVGFTDAHYFLKIFKKHAGFNPSDIKRPS